MLNTASEKSLANFLSVGAAAVTVFVLTGSVSDPVNATKFFLLGGVALAAFAIFLATGWSVLREQKLVLGILFLFLLASINAIVNSNSPFQQNIYGTYGRNTGFLTYLFLSLIFWLLTSILTVLHAQSIYKRKLENIQDTNSSTTGKTNYSSYNGYKFDKKNSLKANLISPFFNILTVFYTKYLDKETALQFGASIMTDFNYTSQDRVLNGQALTIEYRYLLKGSHANGT
jgi:hypothetical protein